MDKKLFAKAAAEAERLDSLDLPHFDGCPYEVSPDFKERVLSLAFPQKKNIRHLRRIICTAAALLAIAAGALTAEAFRSPVKDFVLQLFEKFSYADFNSQKIPPPPKTEFFEPSWLPEGYVLDSSEKTDDLFFSVYKNSAGNTLSFEQTYSSASIIFDTENSSKKVEKLEINGCEAFIFSSDSSLTLYWSNGIYLFSISGNISREEIIKIAESVKN